MYPALRPFKALLGCLPQMRYEELNESSDHELTTLNSQQQPTVTINGREIIKRHLNKVKRDMNEEMTH